jgi:hypothetical protein
MAKRKNADDELLGRVKARFELVNHGAEQRNRDSQRADTEFVYRPGAQWPKKARDERKANGDPCMEFPQLKQFVAQVVNDQRQNRPGIRIHPASGDASEEVAEILQGLIRGIEYDSRAESVYDCGYQHSVVGGRGYWRIVSEYESESSFNQKLLIKRIADPMSVYLDPDYQEPDGGDRQWGFVAESLSKEEFERRYPDADAVDFNDIDLWHPQEGHVLVADYYERTATKRTLVALADGSAVYEDEVPEGALPMLGRDGQPLRRTVDVYRVDWYTIAGGNQVLAKHQWPGSIIPIVCAMGDEIIIDGERVFQGLITQAKDTQTLFNFGMTQQAVHLALAPRAPYIAAVEATAGYENMWNTANTANWSTLLYNAFGPDGTPVPMPQRQMGAQPDAGWINWTQQMQLLMKSTIGMYENTLGMRGQETSGIAIRTREMQGDNATFHFLDNFSRAIALTGRIIVECIPTYYDTARIVHIVGPDDTPKLQPINQQQPDPMNPLQAIKVGDVTTGEYAVTVQAGPGYATKREEAADLMMQMVQAFPQLMQVAGDIVVKMQDVPDADLLAERLKLMLPPPVQQMLAAKEAGEDPNLANLQQQMQMMGQQMQEMQAQAQAQIGQLANENEQLKADRSASIAASQARQAAAEASAENEAQRGQMDMQKAIMDRLTAQEKMQVERDKVFADLLAKLIESVATPQEVAVDSGQATQALEANP